ncbi:MAG: cold shock domain-containing protein [Bacteroidota bacterium]
MKTGVVKFFNNFKGFGFITVDGTGEEVYVSQAGLVDQINDGDKVSFNVEQGRKGTNAINVKKND